MRQIKRHIKKGKELDAQRKVLEERLEGEVGCWVAINYDGYQDIYRFHMQNHFGAVKLAELLGIKTNMQHEITGPDYHQSRLTIKDIYNGQAIEVFCLVTDNEYREGFAKHERTTSKNN